MVSSTSWTAGRMTKTDRVGHYRLIEPIGTGGFATVYRAVDERLESDVAIKILAENHALDPEIRERFITEAQLLRRAASSSVIEIHDIGETDLNQPFIVMSFADRGDLRDRVKDLRTSGGTVDLSDVMAVVDTLADALEAVHRAGLVHRDVKPDNLLINASGGTGIAGHILRPDERLRLGDLGYAKDLAASSGLTVGGGTHGFNAPEQRAGLTTIDTRADIYGASAVIFWLLTGVTPPAASREQRRVLAESAADEPVSEVLVTGLAENPAHRFDSIGDWRAVLLAGTSTAAQSATPPRLPRRLRRGGRTVAIVAACIGLIVGAAAGIGGFAALDYGNGDGPNVSTIDDGRTRVEDRRGDLRIAVFGPRTAQVGVSVIFEAAIQGAVSYTWIAPDGSSGDGTPTLEVMVAEVGTSFVTLVGRDTDGETLAVDFEFEVSE